PDYIGVIGGSAGGHLAVMLGVTGPEDGLDPAGPYGEFPCSVQAVVNLYGVTDWFQRKDLPMFGQTRASAPELYLQATPMTHVDPNDPPILIIHGSADKVVELAQSEKLVAALQQAGVEHEFVVVEGAPHSFYLQVYVPTKVDLRPRVLDFFDRHMKKTPGAVAQPPEP
ncbi:MAG: S9 family peptidase, partial [Candidatus Marinimicrobia bacterium]|nr:S9 family peptidase [Candidatus Neomarinimicrobiota bacterium]